jgi:hypothetical protein
LLSLEWNPSQEFIYHQTLDLPGNALDVAYVQEEHTIMVSTDNIHIPGSVKKSRTDPAPLGGSVVSFQLTYNNTSEGKGAERHLRWRPSDRFASLSASLLSGTLVAPKLASQTNPKATYSELGEFLYGLENLRKSRSDTEVADETIQANISPAYGSAE